MKLTNSHLSVFTPSPNARHSAHSLYSRHGPAQWGQCSQVGPAYGERHLHVPHSQVPLPLQTIWFSARQEVISIVQLQSSLVQPSSQKQRPHSHFPLPPQILLNTSFSLRKHVVFEQKNLLIITYYTCGSSMDIQSCCTGSSFQNIFLLGFLWSHTHRSPPHTFPYRCKQWRLGLSDKYLHLVTWRNQCSSGSVGQHMAHSTHTGHTPEPRGHRSQSCSPDGFLCSHTDLGKQPMFYLPY